MSRIQPIGDKHPNVRIIPSDTVGFWDGQSTYHLDFAGAGEMVRVAEAGFPRTDLHDFSYMTSDAGWIGRPFGTFGDIVKAVDGTWSFGVDRVEEMARELQREELPRPTVVKRRRVWDDFAGDEIDVDRYRSGDPYYRDNARVRTNGPKLISFLVQLGANSWMASDDLFWRGALAITLARIVEDAGYRTEISAFATTAGCTSNWKVPNILTTCNLKQAGDALDVGSLVNVTSGWFFRTVMFCSWTAPGEYLVDGLGSMKEANEKVVSYLSPGARPWVIASVYNKESCLALARKYLAQLVLESK